MADDFGVEIRGVEEVCEELANAPKKLIPRALLAGLTAGGNVLEEAVRARTPQGKPTSEGEVSLVPLAADLDTNVTLDSEFRGGVAEVGFSDMKASWVEYGHRQIGHKPAKKDQGTVAPHPFMRPAAEVVAEAAVDAFEEAVMDVLETGGLADAA
jgi:hypothetical protein